MKKILILGLLLLAILPIVSAKPMASMWFYPNEDMTTWEVYGSHLEPMSVYSFYLPSDIADNVVSYVGHAPLDLFEDWDWSYGILNNGVGRCVGGYQFGEIQDIFVGHLGTLTFDEPTLIRFDTGYNHQPLWWDGLTPNLPRETTWMIYGNNGNNIVQTAQAPMEVTE